MRPIVARTPVAASTAVVLTHAAPRNTDEALRTAAAAARAASCTLVGTEDELERHGEAAAGIERVRALPERPDLCLVLGGDGTILCALRCYARSGVPVFGINFGTVGFLAAAEAEKLDSALERAFAGDLEVLAMPGLEISVEADCPLALNDASLTHRPHTRVAELSYRLAGEEVGRVRCDGLVAATPAGSTGYNLANGGPILAWGVEGFVVTFVAPHTLTARALVVAPDDVLHVRNESARDTVDVALDGRHVAELPAGQEVEIRFREGIANLAQLPGASFYRRVREKFGHLAH